MRTPVPKNGGPRPVQAEFVSFRRERDDTDDDFFDDDRDDELDALLDDDDDEDQDDEEKESAAREVASNEAPWSSVPVRPGREYVRKFKMARMDIVFPTVYEEDRTSKIKDLTSAQAVGAITHQRMAEQMAKELGFEQYNYEEELRQIVIELKKLPPGIISSTDQIAGAGKMGGISIGAPVPGLASEDEDDSPLLDTHRIEPETDQPHRAEIADDSTHAFRDEQRNTYESVGRFLGEISQHLRTTREAIAQHGQRLAVNDDVVRRLAETVDGVISRLEVRLTTVAESQVDVERIVEKLQPIVVPPTPAPQITVEPAPITPPPPRRVQVIRDERGLVIEMREMPTP